MNGLGKAVMSTQTNPCCFISHDTRGGSENEKANSSMLRLPPPKNQSMKKTLRYPCQLLRKTIKLIQQKQIKKISDNLFIVRGTHHNPLGYYTVEKLQSGVWICNCNGFKKRKVPICSHVIAVTLFRACEVE